MTGTNILHTKRTKHYKAPVMLNHRTMMRIVIGVVLSMGVVFVSGYVVGFQKAGRALDVKTSGFEVVRALFEPAMSESDPSVSGIVLLAEADEVGAKAKKQSFDRTAKSENALEDKLTVGQFEELAKSQEIKKQAKLESAQATAQVLPSIITGIAEEKVVPGQVESDPVIINDESKVGPIGSDPARIINREEASQLAIYDNASEETASYSIQVGMFGLLENAKRRVEELIAGNLSAYLVEYVNRQKQMRYKVCFGYFSDSESANDALSIYVKEFSGSGYVIALQPKDSIS